MFRIELRDIAYECASTWGITTSHDSGHHNGSPPQHFPAILYRPRGCVV
jgi:hypothetical protein